jgi:Asp-tRNA(Asn)/Glu-tRNA(Gln) amidotransferase C subunit
MNEDLERVAEAARDALSDEIVARLAGAATDALELVDRVNRSGLTAAIPAFAEMVANGDLDRLVKLARVYGSAEDALSDEIVGRLAATAADSLSLLDRLNRGGGERLVEMLARLESSNALERIAEMLPRVLQKLDTVERLLNAVEAARAETGKGPGAAGGMSGLWGTLREPESQDALRLLINVGKQLRA